ncbi:hypothetical protein PPACK8108_LOCUS9094 [Phakopsora pachyrhizi]|uniref:Uncharacterized protein n=1 Tax=Phakopsora pachyrhizi TaxID=170000 RepID=A0AAV0AXI8_PHAPC|nr:hypothetical protein PPACK8108_LOCUS9094 [Phakopsora pachyrhizi]
MRVIRAINQSDRLLSTVKNQSSRLSPGLKNLIANSNGIVGYGRSDPIDLNQSKSFEMRLRELIERFDKTCGDQRLRPSTWIILSTATIVSLNRPSAFKPLWSLVSGGFKDRIDRSECVELIRESSLKSISFIGIPKSINALNRFNEITQPQSDHQTSKQHQVDRGRRSYQESYNSSSAEIYNRGLRLWKSVYDPLSERLIAKLSDSNPDLPNHIILSHYGHLLSDPTERPGPLGRVATSLVAIGALRSSNELGPQLLSHVLGLKKAFNPTIDGDEDQIRRLSKDSLGDGVDWLLRDEGVSWIIESIDQLVALVHQTESSIIKSSNLTKHQSFSKL